MVRSLAWQTDLAVLRLAGSSVEDRGGSVVVRTPSNPGFRWGNFLLLPEVPALSRLQAVLEQYADLFPASPHVAIGVDGTDGRRVDLHPFAQEGFSVEASSVLTARQVHPPPRPNRSAELRALGGSDDWDQSLELAVAVAGGDQPEAFRDFARRRRDANRRLAARGCAMWFGAFEAGSLRCQLGLVDTGRGVARFQAVETHPDARGRGLAGTLVHHAGDYGFARLRAERLVIVADPDYHAIGIYRSVGFVDTEVQLQAERHGPDAGRSVASTR